MESPAEVSANLSPDCGESKFRELDEVFLQKQARIWLSEVLQRRLDQDQSIADMLADGDLLYEASNVLWKMLMEKGVKVEDSIVFSKPTKSKKRTGKYMPYSNVDSFLKICKIFGLTGIDLFSPSDVVERRDTRKVCMCIRSLSKKARSMDIIHVPDFDIVTVTITMPTNLIGCIRRSLELSRSGSMTSDSHSSYKDSDILSMKDKSVASHTRSYDMYSEESDDADSCASVRSYKPFTKTADGMSLKQSDSLCSIESFSLSKDIKLEEALEHFGVPDIEKSVSQSFLSTGSSGHYHTISNMTSVIDSRGSSDVHHDSDSNLDRGSVIKNCTDDSLRVLDLQCQGSGSISSEEEDKYLYMPSQRPELGQTLDGGEMCYDVGHQAARREWHKNMVTLNFDKNQNDDDDQEPAESVFGTVINPTPDRVKNSGKACSISWNEACNLNSYSDWQEPSMKGIETDISISCLDFQSYAAGHNQDTDASYRSGEARWEARPDTEDYQANLSYQLTDWPDDNEALDDVHLSIIESFLSTTECSRSESCNYNEKQDESGYLSLDGGDDDVGSKPIFLINSYEDLPCFPNESIDTANNVIGELCYMGTTKDMDDTGSGSTDGVFQTASFQGIKHKMHETDPLCEEETHFQMAVQCPTLDKDSTSSELKSCSHPLQDKLKNNKCEEEKSETAAVLIKKNDEIVRSKPSKARKSSILKSVMGGAALVGVLAFVLGTRRGSEKENKPKLDLESSYVSAGNKLSSTPKAKNSGIAKGVYPANKLEFG